MKVGSDWGGAGTFKPFTSAISGAQRSANAHGMFMDATLAGRVYGGGTGTLLAINNATFTVATLGATATPIIGVWNPLSSPFNLIILQASLAGVMTAATSTGPGGFFWAASRSNDALTLGSLPFHRRTLAALGSIAKFFPGTALTGLTNNLVVLGGSSLGGGSAMNYSNVGTAAGAATQMVAGVEYFDGSLIVPPGGVLALLCGTTPVAHSVASSILWEELPALASV